jgi:hypothetical protein
MFSGTEFSMAVPRGVVRVRRVVRLLRAAKKKKLNFCLSNCQRAETNERKLFINSAPNGQIFTKFDI